MQKLFVFCALLSLLPMQVAARTWVVNQNHPKASDTSNATKESPYKTINRAAEQAQPGDTVLVHAGVYRERVAPENSGQPDRPIVYRAAPKEVVIIKGSDLWRPTWKPVANHPNVYSGAFDSSMFRSTSRIHTVPPYNPYAIPLINATAKLCLGQLFVDGEEYQETDNAERLHAFPGTWMVTGKGSGLKVHFRPGTQPSERTIELTVRGRNFAPYRKRVSYITVQGFIMEHCANQYPENFYIEGFSPQTGALGCRSGRHWVIEHNTIRRAKAVGIDCGREGIEDSDGLKQRSFGVAGYHIIRYNTISYNGAAGIVGWDAQNTLVYGNIIEYNNTEGIRGMEGGGIKFHGFNHGLIEGNLLRGNFTAGIWLDNEKRHSRITRNVVINSVGAGIFVELGLGPCMVDNNVVAFTVAGAGLSGDGIYSHDASNVTVAHNLVYFNANFGIWAHVGTDRGGRDSVICSGWRVLNNIVIGNHRGTISLPPVQPRSQDNFSDRNLVAGPFGLTHLETWGAQLDDPVFLVNTNKYRFPVDSLAKLFFFRLDSAKIPAALRPGVASWSTLPLLTLDQWRIFSGNDRNSIIPKVLRPELMDMNLVLQFAIDESIKKIGCSPVKGVDKDLFGTALGKNPLPGPFQKLVSEPALANDTLYATPLRGNFERLHVASERLNRFVLWPLPQADRPEFLTLIREGTKIDIRRASVKKYSPSAVGTTANPVHVLLRKDSIIVDGLETDWVGHKTLPVPFEDKDTGMVRLAWRTEGLYGIVRTPHRRFRTFADAPWEGDGIELCFQVDGRRPEKTDSSTLRFFVLPVNDTTPCGIWTDKPEESKKLSGVQARSRRVESSGHAVEFFIPAALLGKPNLTKNHGMGFNYSVVSRGNPIEEFFIHRATENAWNTPKLWGSVVMTE